MNIIELARKYYPRLWDRARLEALVAAGRLPVEEMEDIVKEVDKWK